MATFNEFKLTKNGANLLSKAQAGETSVNITRASLGSGDWEKQNASAYTMTSLINERMDAPIKSVAYTTTGTTNLVAVLLRENLQSKSFDATEFGVFALDPDIGEILYCCACSDDPQEIPGKGDVSSFEFVFTISISASSASYTESFINDSEVVKKQDLQEQIDAIAGGLRFSGLQAPIFQGMIPNSFAAVGKGAIEVSRASEATYTDKNGLVVYAGIDEPREETEGWLFEGESENICAHSNDADELVVINTGSAKKPVLTPNAGVAPDGSNTAIKVTLNLAGGITDSDLAGVEIPVEYTGSGSTTVTISMWMKSLTESVFVRLDCDGCVSQNGASDIEVQTKWVRFEVPVVLSAGKTDITPLLRLQGGLTGQEVYLLIWGIQVEDCPFATSYIPTNGAVKVRSADKVIVRALGHYSSTDSTGISIVCNLRADWIQNKLISACVFSVANWYDCGQEVTFGAGKNPVWAVGSESELEFIPTVNGFHLACTACPDDGLKVYQDGNGIASSENTIIDSLTDQASQVVSIGGRSDGSLCFFGHISDFRIYDFALSEKEILCLTKEGV